MYALDYRVVPEDTTCDNARPHDRLTADLTLYATFEQ